jgi:hypothetical protein
MNDTEKLNYYETEAEKWRKRLAVAKNPKEIEDCKVELDAIDSSIFFLKRKLNIR